MERVDNAVIIPSLTFNVTHIDDLTSVGKCQKVYFHHAVDKPSVAAVKDVARLSE